MAFKRTQLLVAAIVIFVVGILGFSLLRGKASENRSSLEIISPSPMESNGLIRRASVEQSGNSGQNGKVYWRDDNGKVTVTVDLSISSKKEPQKASINIGDCLKPGEAVFQLNPLTDGKAQTVLETALTDFEAKLPLVLVVSDGQAIAACGLLDKGSEVVDPFEVYGSSSSKPGN